MVKRGHLSVIAGPMFAGKSSSLLQQVLWLEHNQKKTLVIKPHIDDRYDPENIVTHDQLRHRCVSAIDLELVKDNYNIKPYNFNTVFIDEVQFFDPKETLWFVEEGLRSGVNFMCAGLDQDFRGVPFDTTARLMALAEKVEKITAHCTVCGQPATKTYRTVNNDNSRVLVGGAESYEPRCTEHWSRK